MRIKIKEIEFSSPILTASGTYGYGHEVQDLTDVNEWGGIITKSPTWKFDTSFPISLIVPIPSAPGTAGKSGWMP